MDNHYNGKKNQRRTRRKLPRQSYMRQIMLDVEQESYKKPKEIATNRKNGGAVHN